MSVIRWKSTRGGGALIPLSRAISEGLASDGGLYVPERLPAFKPEDFAGLDTHPAIAEKLLAPFFGGDSLEPRLRAICRDAFDFPLILKKLEKDRNSGSSDPRQPEILELFHGPTAAFKDFGARFLARALSHLPAAGSGQHTILVATSGDTGGAVAAAFWRQKGCQAVVLFPKGRVSARQQRQLTSWGENVRAFAVEGDFDDCQRMVKACFQDAPLRKRLGLTSANSINAGRLLPQSTYYAAASLWHWRETGRALSFLVPTGNLGNALSAVWARAMGLPIGKVTLATNENRSLSEYFQSGQWKVFATQATLANAMDVGNPSNFERLLELHGSAEELKRSGLSVVRVSDVEIRSAIREANSRWNEAICPHTATALHAWLKDPAADSAIVSTAHPAKFESIVEPILGRAVPVPEALQAVLSRAEKFEVISADPSALSARL